jgi:hypothetical protein
MYEQPKKNRGDIQFKPIQAAATYPTHEDKKKTGSADTVRI